MESLFPGSALALGALVIPVILGIFGMFSARRGGLACGAALLLAALFAVGAALTVGLHGPLSSWGVRLDLTTAVMLLLVVALGSVIVRFSTTYLAGEHGLNRYRRWLLLTLSVVTALVVSNNLLVIAVMWTGTSLALHQLLTFYGHREAAQVAAHKKFLVSRLADAALVPALWLLYRSVGSLDLDRIATWAHAQAELPAPAKLAAALLVIAVALRSAQLPFHGWLMQVMEAPTPVSALLHAGVVNIGGFVLIRLAPWISRAELAQVLLVAIGISSTTVAALTMTTRVSAKVALAWSTCAQMGFMLVECGLGLWSVALLHLAAHSLYKAHAFLRAGSAVADWKLSTSIVKLRAATALQLLASLALSAALTLLGRMTLNAFAKPESAGESELVLTLMVVLSLVPLLLPGVQRGLLPGIRHALRSGAVVLLYLGAHALVTHLVPGERQVPRPALSGLTLVGFLTLFIIKSALELRPSGRFARALHPWLFSGLYLDELFTRLTFRLWPPRFRFASNRPQLVAPPLHQPAPLEVQS